MADDKIKILIAKLGRDGHDRGAKVVSSYLRNAGMEVVYLGMYQTPESVVAAAQQEDVDVVGLSCHCNEHLTEVPKIQDLMRQQGMDDVLLVVGGVMPLPDVDVLHARGVEGVFRVGVPLEEIVGFIRRRAAGRRGVGAPTSVIL